MPDTCSKMHPRVFLDNFWRNDLEDEVFVCMAFHARFRDRWESIFKPAIEGSAIHGKNLRAVRVDIRKSGDSILTEIISGIAHAQLVLADISVTDEWEEDGESRWSRNGNVMYEVGLAIACRQRVEVVLVRDDDKPLLFDLSDIPVRKFDPGNAEESIALIKQALEDRLQERDLINDIRFLSTLESLTQFEISLIRRNAHLSLLAWKGPSYPRALAIALPRILDKRILRLLHPDEGDRPHVYTWTTFGRAIADRLSAGSKAAT